MVKTPAATRKTRQRQAVAGGYVRSPSVQAAQRDDLLRRVAEGRSVARAAKDMRMSLYVAYGVVGRAKQQSQWQATSRGQVHPHTLRRYERAVDGKSTWGRRLLQLGAADKGVRLSERQIRRVALAIDPPAVTW
jgi:hypothetical protein